MPSIDIRSMTIRSISVSPARPRDDWKPRRARFGLAALLCLACGPLAGEIQKQPPPQKKPAAARNAAQENLTLEEALLRVRRDYLPVVIFYDGGENRPAGSDALPEAWKVCCRESRAIQELLRKGLLCRLEDASLPLPYPDPPPPRPKAGAAAPKGGAADPPQGQPDAAAGKAAAPEPGGDKDPAKDRTAAARLGVVPGVPALILLDFRERVARRHTEKLPPAAELQKEIAGVFEQSRAQAAVARRVEKILEKSRYAYELKDIRTAVQLVLPLEEPKERKPMDALLLEQVVALTAKFRAEAEEVFKKAEDLSEKNKHLDAVKSLEEISRNYPFVDLLRRANQKKGEFYRKAQVGF